MLNSKKTVSICLLAMALAASAFADSNTRQSATSNKTLLAVGSCSAQTRQDANSAGTDANGNALKYKEMPYAQLDLKYCQEYDQYQVTVSGNSWNTSENKVPNSDSMIYQAESDSKSYDSKLDQAGPVNEDQKIQIGGQDMEQCNQARDQMLAQLKSQPASRCAASN